MALVFDEQLSRLQKPDRDEMTDAEYEVFNSNVEVMMKNWGFINNLFKILPVNASQYIGFLNFKASLFNENCYLVDDHRRRTVQEGLLRPVPSDEGRRMDGGAYRLV